MARKQVSHYALFHNADGTASVNVYYAEGGADTIRGLPLDDADHIIDILRNEKPIDYDHDRRRFLSGAVEAVGEGEGGRTAPFFRLENWIRVRAWLAEVNARDADRIETLASRLRADRRTLVYCHRYGA